MQHQLFQTWALTKEIEEEACGPWRGGRTPLPHHAERTSSTRLTLQAESNEVTKVVARPGIDFIDGQALQAGCLILEKGRKGMSTPMRGDGQVL